MTRFVQALRLRRVPAIPGRVRRFVAAHGYEASDRSLATYRICFALGILLMFTPTSTVSLAAVPDEFFHPPLGPMMLLGGWPNVLVLVALELAVQLLLVMLLFGVFTRPTSLALAAVGALLAGYRYSTGKIDHEFLIVVAVPALLAFTSWGDRWSVDARRRRVRGRQGFRAPATWQLQALALTVGASYLTSGLAKAATGWLDLSGSAGRGWLLTYLHDYAWAPNPVNTLVSQIPWLWAWKLMDVGTVVAECGVIVAALRRRWLLPYLVLLIAFHLSVFAMFGINFSRLLLVYLAFLHLDRLADRLRLDRTDRFRMPEVVGAAVLVAAWVGAGFLADREPIRLLRVASPYLPLPSGAVIPGAALAIVSVVVAVRWCHRYADRRAEQRADGGRGAAAAPEGAAADPRSAPADRRPSGPAPHAVTVLATVVAVFAAQFTLLVTYTEPHPAPTGPLFMGNRDGEDGVVVFRQYMSVESGGGTYPTRAVRVLPISDTGFVTTLRQVRFPMPPVTADGLEVDRDAGRQASLRMQGHRFSSAHLRGYDGQLSPRAAAWIRKGLRRDDVPCVDRCTLVVAWVRDVVDRRDGEPLPGHRVTLERRRWDLPPR